MLTVSHIQQSPVIAFRCLLRLSHHQKQNTTWASVRKMLTAPGPHFKINTSYVGLFKMVTAKDRIGTFKFDFKNRTILTWNMDGVSRSTELLRFSLFDTLSILGPVKRNRKNFRKGCWEMCTVLTCLAFIQMYCLSSKVSMQRKCHNG